MQDRPKAWRREGGVEMLKIQIEGEAKEITALVLELKERQGIRDEPKLSKNSTN